MEPKRSRALPLAEAPARERADAAENRRKILAAAREMLGRKPIDSIHMDELAEAAGVGKGTLYRRFRDRCSLCQALLDDAERALQEQVLASFGLPLDTPAERRLAVLLEALVSFAIDNVELLAEASAFARGHGTRLDAPPYRWRRRALVLAMTKLPKAPEHPELSAEMVLACLDPDVIRRHFDQHQNATSLSEARQAYASVLARLLRAL